MNDFSPSQHERCKTDVLIVGAGPIGLQLAVALKRQGINFRIVDAGSIGQTISWWAPQTRWFSGNDRIAISGVPLVTVDQSKATREQYLAYLRGVAMQFQIEVCCFEKVIDVSRSDRGFTVSTETANAKRLHECQRVVLAIGGTDHPNALGVPGETLPMVDGYLREPHRYFGRRVLVIGGRNSAVEAAIRLHHAGAHVSLSYRGESLPQNGVKYWLYPEIQGLLNAGRIGNYLGTRVVEIQPGRVTLERVAQADPDKTTVPERVRYAIEVDDVLSLIGYRQDKSLFHKLGLDLVEASERPAVNPSTMESSVAGVYVAGTAVAGTQGSRYRVFLENCHEHVDRIVSHLLGKEASESISPLAHTIRMLPES